MMNSLHRVHLPLGVSVALLCASGVVDAAELQKVTFMTSWYAQAEHGGFYQAKAKGFYEKEGFDVTIKMGGPQINGMQLLLAGETDFYNGFDFQVLSGVEQKLPVKAVAAMFQHDVNGMLTHKDVDSLAGLKDKTLMIATSARASWWPWLKSKHDLKDTQVKPYTFNVQPFLVDKQSAQQAFPSSEPFTLEQQGVPHNFFLFADEGYPPYGITLVTRTDIIKDKPDVVEKFVKASIEGWKSYLADPSAGNVLIKQANPKMSDEGAGSGCRRRRCDRRHRHHEGRALEGEL
jgi:NitT/TauT family transport system substrate-binding protein